LEYVSSGGTASATTINGGTLDVASGGSTSGTITFTSSGGILELGLATFHATISGFASPPGVTEQIDLQNFGSGTTLSFTEAKGHTSGTLTVTSGTTSATITLDGNYTSSNFTLSSGSGGTIITDPTTSSHTSNTTGSQTSNTTAGKNTGSTSSDTFAPSDGFTTLASHTSNTAVASYGTGKSSSGTLPISDAAPVGDLTLLGQYSAAGFGNPSTGPATAFVTPSLVGSAASPVLAAHPT